MKDMMMWIVIALLLAGAMTSIGKSRADELGPDAIPCNYAYAGHAMEIICNWTMSADEDPRNGTYSTAPFGVENMYIREGYRMVFSTDGWPIALRDDVEGKYTYAETAIEMIFYYVWKGFSMNDAMAMTGLLYIGGEGKMRSDFMEK